MNRAPRLTLVRGFACAIGLAVLICAAGAQPGPVPESATWLAKEIGRRGVIDNLQSALRIEAGSASGRAGCNRFMGNVTFTANLIRFGRLATTRMSCPPAVMDQERRFLAAIEAARAYSFDGPILLLRDRSGAVLMRLSPIRPK